MPFTTIRIEWDVREQLKATGKKGETYNEIIKRLLQIAGQYEVETGSGGTSYYRRSTQRPSDFG